MADRPDDNEACICSGRYGTVKFARAENGSLMVKAEWDKQVDGWRKAFKGRFLAITNDQTLRLSSRESFNQVEGELWEFKHNGRKSRIFTFRDDRCWYLVDCFTAKKEDELPAGVVKRAIDRMKEAKVVLARRKGKDRT